MKQADLQRYVDSQEEESLTLDYKAASSIARTDLARREIAKDVSAFANSAGGRLIYGLSEDPANRHLPGAIDPIDGAVHSKEWLEQVISAIRRGSTASLSRR